MPQKSDNQKQLRKDIRLLGNILGQVILQQAGPEIYGLVERIRSLAKSRRRNSDPVTDAELSNFVDNLSLDEKEAVARAFTLYFELINLAEEHHRVRVLRDRERKARGEPQKESIAAALATLSRMGVKEEDVAQMLNRLQVELVFTAHPTENKRRTILSKLRRIALALYELEQHDPLPTEAETLITAIQAEITSLWLTHRSRTLKPTVKDEVRTGLWHFYSTLWQVIPQVYDAMDKAVQKYYPNIAMPKRFLTFGTWIGGDRDGNPYVTTAVTADALYRYRRLAAESHAAAIQKIGRSLSISSRLIEPSPELLSLQDEYEDGTFEHVDRLRRRYRSETYRLVASNLAQELERTHDDNVAARLLGEAVEPLPKVRQAADILRPLSVMYDSLRASGLAEIARVNLNRIFYQAEVFGLHMAHLDIRQYSSQHHQVLAEILGKLG
ncbi:MAG: phosphoenolpyruvate carboxylase, partial [Anaerolineae bacterium]|nr:phosphoenolpyruvate carboxylase [Anaerolineae bacterium]